MITPHKNQMYRYPHPHSIPSTATPNTCHNIWLTIPAPIISYVGIISGYNQTLCPPVPLFEIGDYLPSGNRQRPPPTPYPPSSSTHPDKFPAVWKESICLGRLLRLRETLPESGIGLIWVVGPFYPPGVLFLWKLPKGSGSGGFGGSATRN